MSTSSTAEATAPRPRRSRFTGAVVLLVSVIGAISTIWVIADQISEKAAASAPTCEDPGSLEEVMTPAAIASSFLTESSIVHSADRLIDGNLNRAWVEGVAGYGVNEWIEFTFSQPIDLKLICVVNGYAGTLAQYEKNARVAQFEITTAPGTTTDSLAVKPSADYTVAQSLDFDKGPTTLVRLTVKSTRPGTGADATEDTSISEVTFWGRPTN